MCRRLLIFIVFVNISSCVFSQSTLFSDSAVVSLLTYSPGEAIYLKFGHTAIRIKDTTTGVDILFNYGMFDFSTKNFYLKFIQGKTDYQLGVTETDYLSPIYMSRHAVVWEQKLNLNISEKQNLISSLLQNYAPENRMYRYNFAFDNCSTRPRDKIITSIQGNVVFHPMDKKRETFRNWIGKYVGNDTWLKFGIDLLFGLEADKFATSYESMFLPELLMQNFQNATIVSNTGNNRKLVLGGAIRLIDSKKNTIQKTAWFSKPLTISVFVLLIGILLGVVSVKKIARYNIIYSIILFISGLCGMFIMYMSFFSEHPLVQSNLNILWLNPLNILLALIIWVPQSKKIVFVYQMIYCVLLCLAVFSGIFIQAFNIAFFPIILLLLFYSFVYNLPPNPLKGELKEVVV